MKMREEIPKNLMNLFCPDHKQNLLDAIEKLTGMEFLEIKEEMDRKIEELKDREENFFLRDYFDDWFYLVNYEDGSYLLFTKGKNAYDEYVENPNAIAITRKTKDLFPTYQTMMTKDDSFVFMPQKKGAKEVSKKDYDIQYQKEHLKRIYFVLNKSLDFDIIEYLSKKENVNGFLKDLVREEMKREKFRN